MNIWTAMKRLNRHFDRWSARAANHVVTTLDHAGEPQKPGAARHIGVWDLLGRKRAPGASEAAEKK